MKFEAEIKMAKENFMMARKHLIEAERLLRNKPDFFKKTRVEIKSVIGDLCISEKEMDSYLDL